MLSDLDIDFYSVIAKTWTPDEAEGWTTHAERVEAGIVLPSFHYPPSPPVDWLEDWKARGRPTQCNTGCFCPSCGPKGTS
jgi:hypothetical protein